MKSRSYLTWLTRRFVLRVAIGTAVVAAAATAAPRAVAADPSAEREIVTAEAAFSQLGYDDALARAEAALKIGKLTHDQLVRTYRIIAVSRAITEEEEKARQAFVLLLTYDPEVKLDSGQGPKVQQPFLEAKGFWRGQASKPGIEVAPQLRRGETGALRVTLRDPTRAARKSFVAYRWGGEGTYRRVDITAGEQLVPVPASAASTRLDYFAQALDDRENAIFEVGNGAAPKTALVELLPQQQAGAGEKRAPGSIFSSPVFWIAAGLVVLGGATGGVLLATRKEKEQLVPPSSATLGPVLVCGSDRCQ